MKNLNFRILIAFISFTFISSQSYALDALTAKLILKAGDSEIKPGQCINGSFDYTDLQFIIVDHDEKPVTDYEILDGSLLPAISTDAIQGKILKGGKVDAQALEIIKNTNGNKVSFLVTSRDVVKNNVRTWHFHFYRNVQPEIAFGEVEQGEKGVALEEVVNISTLSVLFKENPSVIKYKVVSGALTVDGVDLKGKILANGDLDANALEIIKQAAGKQVTILVSYTGPAREEKRTALVFTVQ